MLTLAMPQSLPAGAQEALRRNQAGGEDRRGEALRNVVVPGDGLLERVELDQVQNGREDLLAQDGHFGT
jgi:hypothetical protein